MVSTSDIRYSYLGVPTLEAFADSNAFIRGVVGPFGCLSGATEFLTPAGWKRMDEYAPTDRVAQWSPATGRIEFVYPSAFVREPCAELIEFRAGGLVMQLSEEHRVPHMDWAGRFTVKTAAEIEKHPSRRMIPTTFEGTAADSLDMSDDLIRFAVMMHADGHYPKRGRKAVVVLRRERKKTRLRALLNRLGVEFTETVYPARPTEAQFRFVPPYRGKHYAGAWWAASARELAIVLDEMRHWDGYDGGDLRFASSHKEDADFIQYAAHANGLRAVVREQGIETYAAKGCNRHYTVYVRFDGSVKNAAYIREGTQISRIPTADGQKYCFTVPSSFFVVRCEDTIFITGNSGKSSAMVIEIVNRAMQQAPGPDGVRRSRWAVIRNTFPELRDTTIRTVMEWLPERYFGRYIEHKHSYVITAFEKVEFELLFLALDRPEDVKKLLSLELTGAWVNEAREVPWSIIEALQGRVGRFPSMRQGGPTWSGIFLDTNPPDTDSKWYSFFEDRNWVKDFDRLRQEGVLPADMKADEYACIFRQPSGLSKQAENLPNLNGGRLYYARLATGKTPEWVKIYVHGQYGFLVEGKLIYPNYVDKAHCKSVEPLPGIPIMRSWDFGLTPACIFQQELPDGRWLVFNEMCADNMSVDKFSDDVIEHCNRAFQGNVDFDDVGDPAGENRAETDARSSFDILHGKGIMIRAARSQDPTIRQGAVDKALRAVASGFEPVFVLHPRCKITRKGFLGGYHRRKLRVSGAERYSEKAEKNEYSHPHDALQYGVEERFAPLLLNEGNDDHNSDFDREDYAAQADRSKFTGY